MLILGDWLGGKGSDIQMSASWNVAVDPWYYSWYFFCHIDANIAIFWVISVLLLLSVHCTTFGISSIAITVIVIVGGNSIIMLKALLIMNGNRLLSNARRIRGPLPSFWLSSTYSFFLLPPFSFFSFPPSLSLFPPPFTFSFFLFLSSFFFLLSSSSCHECDSDPRPSSRAAKLSTAPSYTPGRGAAHAPPTPLVVGSSPFFSLAFLSQCLYLFINRFLGIRDRGGMCLHSPFVNVCSPCYQCICFCGNYLRRHKYVLFFVCVFCFPFLTISSYLQI